MKKSILFILISISCNAVVLSQGCLPEGITFTTQEQIDNFQANYPGCTEIIGNIIIGDFGNNITNLNSLSVLTSIDGNLSIYLCDSLIDLTGLEGLNYIGGSLNIGNVTYGGNLNLSSFSGLNNLTYIGGGLGIISNKSITYLSGLDNLYWIGFGLGIFSNNQLSNLTG
jgi:hypothetical protein